MCQLTTLGSLWFLVLTSSVTLADAGQLKIHNEHTLASLDRHTLSEETVLNDT